MRRCLRFLLMLAGMLTASEPGLSLSIGAARISPEQAGLAIVASYLADLGNPGQEVHRSYGWGYLRWEPEVEVAAGPGGFGHAAARAMAVACFTRRVVQVVDGKEYLVPDTLGVTHDLVLSGGLETTPELDRLAGVAELGYIPWLPPGLDRVQFGAFVQGGYEAVLVTPDTNGVIPASGPVARARATLSADVRVPRETSRAVGLQCAASSWYDLLDGQLHYTARLGFQLFLTQERSIDITYQRNSGAPEFEQGNQFGLGLTVRLGG